MKTVNLVRRITILSALIATLGGCAALDATLAVLEILEPTPEVAEVVAKPVPLCSAKYVGILYDGATCMEHTDGSYAWAKPVGD